MKNKIKRIICALKGHNLGDNEESTCYIRDGRRFTYHGRVYRCKRCGLQILMLGIQPKEMAELFRATLEDLPSDMFTRLW